MAELSSISESATSEIWHPGFGELTKLSPVKFVSDVYLPTVNNEVNWTIEHNQEVTKCHHYVHPMAPDFRRVFTFKTQNQEVDYRTSKVSTWHNSAKLNHIYDEFQAVADHEDADYDDEDGADN